MAQLLDVDRGEGIQGARPSAVCIAAAVAFYSMNEPEPTRDTGAI
jgi:hypothetical protein